MALVVYHNLKAKLRRRHFWIGAVLGIVAIVGWACYDICAAQWYLHDSYIRAAHTDPGWRGDQLLAAAAHEPAELNSARLVEEVTQLLPSQWDALRSSESKANRHYVETCEDLPTRSPLSDEQRKALKERLAPANAALAAARRLANVTYGGYPFRWDPLQLQTPWLEPPTQSYKAGKVAKLLELDAIALAEDGRIADSLTSCRAIVSAARSIGMEPFDVSQQLRRRCGRTGVRCMERALAQGAAEEHNLAVTQGYLELEEREPFLYMAARAESVYGCSG